MLAVIDHRAPVATIKALESYCDSIFRFTSADITYNSISGHPDIFIYQDSQGLIIAPNSPKEFLDFLKKHNVGFVYGTSTIGPGLKESTGFNCLSTDMAFFHKQGFTDSSVYERNQHKRFISLPQAYTRCSMIQVSDNSFLTSDKGIEKVLLQKGYECIYFAPNDIRIKDHDHGFVGGTCGMHEDRIFFLGNIDKHHDGAKLRDYLNDKKLEIVCLSDEYLYDGGGIFFV